MQHNVTLDGRAFAEFIQSKGPFQAIYGKELKLNTLPFLLGTGFHIPVGHTFAQEDKGPVWSEGFEPPLDLAGYLDTLWSGVIVAIPTYDGLTRTGLLKYSKVGARWLFVGWQNNLLNDAPPQHLG